MLFLIAELILLVILQKCALVIKSPPCASSPSSLRVVSGGTVEKEKRLGVVVPFPIKHDATVQHALSLWETACEKPCVGSTCMLSLIHI